MTTDSALSVYSENRSEPFNAYSGEGELISERGLPRRPWYRHQIDAPGFYTGYGVKTISGVREAIEGGNRDEAGQRIGEASAALLRLTARRGRAM